MVKLSKSLLLLTFILTLSFLYRVFLMMRASYPPGVDIGLHDSVIHSITQSGNTNFLWNFYHMGAGVSVTFPGYHIFVSYIILMTGLPDIWAHALVASLFSSLIVLVAFLIARKVWTPTAALVVTVLVAFSRFDIEMLMWGGYPNTVALLLIPLTFYVFLQREKLSLPSFLVVASLLSGAIFLTHSLSAVMFIAITFSAVFLGTVFHKQFKVQKKDMLLWLLPLVLGAFLIAPFLVEAVPLFLGADGVAGAKLALVSTQTLALDLVLPVAVYLVLLFLFSRKYRGKFLTIPALLLSLWVLLPEIASQGYLVGFYMYFDRLNYFVSLPAILLVGLTIAFASEYLSKAADAGLSRIKKLSHARENAQKIVPRLKMLSIRKIICVIFIVAFALYSLFSISLFVVPSEGVQISSFYQLMNDPLYEAMQWAKNSTPPDAIFAGDGLYGWWFAGFAQRQTLSATEPQYISLSREFEPAKNSMNLLDTDYVLDNGLMQVREDGGYIGRNNPMFLAKLSNSYKPYGLFNFNSDEVIITCRTGDNSTDYVLSQIPVRDMHVENTSSYAAVIITRGNQLLNFTQKTTVYSGVRFANMSITVETDLAEVHLDQARLIMHAKNGQFYDGENSVAFVETQTNMSGQLIFTENQPQANEVTSAGNPAFLELSYDLAGKSSARIELSVGLFQVPSGYSDSSIHDLMLNNTQTYGDKTVDLPLDVFDYRKFLRDWNVSYVLCRDSEAIQRLTNDPEFSVVFANDAVTVFNVKK